MLTSYTSTIYLSEEEYTIIQSLNNDEDLNGEDLFAKVDLSRSDFWNNLRKLMRMGYVKRVQGKLKKNSDYDYLKKIKIGHKRDSKDYPDYMKFVNDIPEEKKIFVRNNMDLSRKILSEKTNIPRFYINFIIMYYKNITI